MIDIDWSERPTPEHTKAIETEYMPKVGEWCECNYPMKWSKVFVIGIDKSDETVIQLKSGEIMSVGELAKFRPIKSDRDVFKDKVSELCVGFNTDGSELDKIARNVADVIYDHGARFTDD